MIHSYVRFMKLRNRLVNLSQSQETGSGKDLTGGFAGKS